MAFRKAERRKAKLRLGLVGPAGSGKTYSALQVAFGLGGRVALIDTENGSGDLYAHLGEYDVCTLEAPYTVKKYLEAIKEAERAGYDVIVIDSISHAWAGEGGLLDQQGKYADGGTNGYAAWRKVTPQHNQFVEAMLTSKCHVIATMRSKVEYALQENDKGKMVPIKIGMAPVQREGMDFEMTLVFDLDVKHNAIASKDRTSLFDGQIISLSQETGRNLLAWLESGTTAPVAPSSAEKTSIWQQYLALLGDNAEHAKSAVLKITEGRGYNELTQEDCEALRADLELRRSSIAAKLGAPKGQPDAQGFDKIAALQSSILELLGDGGGLGLTPAEQDAYIKERAGKPLGDLSDEEADAVIAAAQADLAKRGGV